jgi:hypothetical protein
MQCRRRQATLHGLPDLPLRQTQALRQTQVIRLGVHHTEDFDVMVPPWCRPGRVSVVQIGVEVTMLRSGQPFIGVWFLAVAL